VEKCMTCQYYDRRHGKAQGGALQWGQCRRSSPMLNPLNAKSYMIEGVWPTVRDDDWCGEWKLLARRVDGRVAEALNAPLISAHAVAPRIHSGKVVPAAQGTPVASAAAPAITPLAATVALGAGRSGND
jgi:hypothetical protein